MPGQEHHISGRRVAATEARWPLTGCDVGDRTPVATMDRCQADSAPGTVGKSDIHGCVFHRDAYDPVWSHRVRVNEGRQTCMPIRAVLWDVDDTLFDYTRCDQAAALDHLTAEGLLSRYESVEAALHQWREAMQLQYDRFLAGELSFAEHRRARARQVLGQHVSDAEAEQWFGRYVTRYEAGWQLFPDAVPVLDSLAADYRQGVLSNSYAANQDRKLRRLGIRDRFEVLVCAAEIGCAKPAPEAFEAACAALSLEPDEVVYVGDRLDIDAVAAAAAGLTGVWVDRTGAAEHSLPDGVTRVTGLTQLPGFLSSLNADMTEAGVLRPQS